MTGKSGLTELYGDEQWEVSFRKPPPHPPPRVLSSSPTDRWDGRSLFTVTSSKTVFGREGGRMEVESEGRIQDVVLCLGSCSHAFSLLVPCCRCTSSPPTDTNTHTHTTSPAPCFFDHISLFLSSVAAHRGFQQEVLISSLLLHVTGLKYTHCPSSPRPAAEPRGSALFLQRAHHGARAKHVCRA